MAECRRGLKVPTVFIYCVKTLTGTLISARLGQTVNHPD